MDRIGIFGAPLDRCVGCTMREGHVFSQKPPRGNRAFIQNSLHTLRRHSLYYFLTWQVDSHAAGKLKR